MLDDGDVMMTGPNEIFTDANTALVTRDAKILAQALRDIRQGHGKPGQHFTIVLATEFSDPSSHRWCSVVRRATCGECCLGFGC